MSFSKWFGYLRGHHIQSNHDKVIIEKLKCTVCLKNDASVRRKNGPPNGKCAQCNRKETISKTKVSISSPILIPTDFEPVATRTRSKTGENKYKKVNIPLTVKSLVWDKYVGIDIGRTKCYCCKLNHITMISFHCGHVIPEVYGGEITVENLRPICQSCNSSMGSQNMNEFMKKYKL